MRTLHKADLIEGVGCLQNTAPKRLPSTECKDAKTTRDLSAAKLQGRLLQSVYRLLYRGCCSSEGGLFIDLLPFGPHVLLVPMIKNSSEPMK